MHPFHGPELIECQTLITMNKRSEMIQLRRQLDAKDLELLLRAEPGEVLGYILSLNRAPRYRNRLDAILLTASVLAIRARTACGPVGWAAADSSAEFPASSD